MMSITLMLLLALVIFAENVLPHGLRTSAAVAVGLIALGLLVASGASSCPGMPELSHSLVQPSFDIDQKPVLHGVHHPGLAQDGRPAWA